MLLSSRFQPTVDYAPCPPFFVDNVYDIFISTAESTNLTAEVTDEVWSRCTLLYPYPTTTTSTTTTTLPTTTTTTEQTTTTSPTTTSTTEQTTTSTTKQTTTTTPKTTTTTTEQTTTTPKQTTTTPKLTTTATTQQTTTTPEQTTTSTTILPTTTTSTSKQTITTTPKQTTTTTPDKTVSSTTKLTTPPTTIKTSTLPSSISESTTTTSIRSSTKETTEGPVSLTASGQCDVICLSLALVFAVCILLGILISLIYCHILRQNRKHKFKHSHRSNGRTTSGKYIPKFPNMSRRQDLTRGQLAFINPTFLIESEPFDRYEAEYQPITDIFPWSQSHSDLFPDYDHSHYEIFSSSEPYFHHKEDQKNRYSNTIGHSRSADVNNRSHVRHPSIGSHVPKMLPEYSEIYPFGVEIYDTSSRNSGLPKMTIDFQEDDERMDAGARQKKLPRIPLEDDASDSPYTSIRTKRTDAKEVYTMNENNGKRKMDGGSVTHGLPRTPFEETEVSGETVRRNNESVAENNSFNSKHGLPRIPFDKTEVRGETVRRNNENAAESSTYNSKHGLPRTLIEQPGFEEFLSPKQSRQPRDFKARGRESVANGNVRPYVTLPYQGHDSGGIDKSVTRDKYLPEAVNIDQSVNTRLHYTRL